MAERAHHRFRRQAVGLILLVGTAGLAATVEVDDVRGAFVRRMARREWSKLGAATVPQDSLPLQRWSYDCGQAALAVAWRHVGGPANARSRIDAVLPPRFDGVTTDELLAAASRLGLEGRYVPAGSLHDLVQSAPAVALLPIGHFAVVLSITNDEVHIFDPLAGLQSVSIGALHGARHAGAVSIAHSARIDTIGSTRVALTPGTTQLASAAIVRTPTAPSNDTGSSGDIW